MLISVLTGLISALICSPIWVVHLYRSENLWQKNQIYIDNAAILIGRKDREFMNRLEKEVQQLTRLHQMYHHALACSLVPAVSASCISTANNLKKVILGLSKAAKIQHQLLWERIRGEVSDYLFQNQIAKNLIRSRTPPLSERHCKICGLVDRWKVEEASLKTHIQALWNSEIRVSVSAIKVSGTNWSYRLWAT